MKIIASLTTTPHRIDIINCALDSIINQTIPIDSVEINIPYVFKKTGREYKIPEWLYQLEKDTKKNKCKFKIFRTEDYGPITKVAPALLRHKNSKDTLIWSVDDDFEYPVNMLAVLFREYIPKNNYILSHSGGHWLYNQDNLVSQDHSFECTGYSSHRREGFVDFLEGFATVLYPSNLIEKDFKKYILKTIKNIDCKNSDDIILSNYFKSKGVKIHNCAYPYTKEHKLLGDFGLPYGANGDALHKEGGGNEERYVRVFNWLKEQNLNAWCG